MIGIESLKIYNFGLIKKTKLKFPSNDLVYVAGLYQNTDGNNSNAAGKSTFLNALWYSLTGEVIQKISVGEIVGPYDGYTETTVILKDSKKTYKITRKRARTGPPTLSFYAGDKNLTAKNPTLTEEVIQEQLGINWYLFKHTNYIPQSESFRNDQGGFIYVNETERRNIIGCLYSEGPVDKVLEVIKKELSTNRSKQDELALTLANLHGKIEQAQQQLDSLSVSISDAKIKNAKAKKASKVSEEEINDLTAKVARHSRLVLEAKTTRHKLEAEHRGLKKQHIDVANEMAGLTSEMGKLVAEQDGILGKIKPLKKSLKKEKKCPTCGQSLGAKEVPKLKKQCNDYIHRYRKIEDVLMPGAQKQIDAVVAQEKGIDEKCAILEGKMQALDREMEDESEKRDVFWEKKNTIMAAQSEVVDIDALIENHAGLKRLLKDMLSKSLLKNNDLDNLKQNEERLKKLEYGYAHAIRSMIFESVIDKFTEEVGVRLREICGLQLMVKFDTKTEKNDKVIDKFDIQVKDADIAEWKSVGLASAGQRRVISLAIAMAMMSISSPPVGLCMLDEALENVDPTVTKRALRALRELAKGSLVLYVTHDPKVPDGERSITAVRKGGVISLEG